MTTAVRTGGPGAKGVSVLVVPLDLPGVSRRKIKNSGFNAGESTWVTLDDVVVPVDHLIGEENNGFRYLMASKYPASLPVYILEADQTRLQP